MFLLLVLIAGPGRTPGPLIDSAVGLVVFPSDGEHHAAIEAAGGHADHADQ